MLFYVSGHVISLEVCPSVEDYTDDVSDQCRDIIKRLQYVNPTINEVCMSCMFVSVYVLYVCQHVRSVCLSVCSFCMFVSMYVLYVCQCVCPVYLSVCISCMFFSVYVLYICQYVCPVCYTELLTLKSA